MSKSSVARSGKVTFFGRNEAVRFLVLPAPKGAGNVKTLFLLRQEDNAYAAFERTRDNEQFAHLNTQCGVYPAGATPF